jgi:hypothetical protein
MVYLRAQLLLGGLEAEPGALANVRALLEHSLQQPGFRWCTAPVTKQQRCALIDMQLSASCNQRSCVLFEHAWRCPWRSLQIIHMQ